MDWVPKSNVWTFGVLTLTSRRPLLGSMDAVTTLLGGTGRRVAGLSGDRQIGNFAATSWAPIRARTRVGVAKGSPCTWST
jgi:hypothetical protein